MNHHLITLDSGERFGCAPDDTLLRAALRAGIGFPYECNSGGCGSCAFDLVSGEVADLWPEAPGLSARGREHGKRLACQSVPTSECVIRIRPKLDCVPQQRPRKRSAKLLAKTPLTHDMIEFHFHADDAAHFLPGQYAMLTLPGVANPRAYSMSNLPNVDGLWKFVVKRTPKGLGTAALFDRLTLGDEIVLDGPFGMSYLRTDCLRDIICIGGGSGISPLLAILQAAAHAPQLRERRLTLFYGGRTPADLCVPQALARDATMQARVQCIPAISEPSITDWNGERGFIHDVFKRWLPEPSTARLYEYYFCGPPPMTDAVQRLLVLDLRVPAVQLHFDRFL